MIRSAHRGLRSTADRLARWTGLLSRREHSSARGLTVLMYHRVLPDERCPAYPLSSLAMPASAFREQVRWLAEHGDLLTLSEALARGDARETDRPRFAITVDDGYDDSARYAAPAVEEVGARATFFVTTGFVGADELLWFDRALLQFLRVPAPARLHIVQQFPDAARRLAGAGASSQAGAWIGFLKRASPAERRSMLAALEEAAGELPRVEGYGSMSLDELRGLHARGHEVGSHSVTHALLPELDDAALERELRGARAMLSDLLGADIPGFCYPNGDCDARVRAAVARAGHRYACTTQDGLHGAGDDPLRIRRVDVVPDRVLDRSGRFDSVAFRRELSGLYRRRGAVAEAG